ncbi:MAG: Na/Pi cotransporter family protein, partial [Erysipelotrichaceae bacterium]|nr:Na/Pi cotransporter family protein [Erysipelotrichaceae bacterium]
KKDIGTILVGFAVLMFGMETMSGAVKPLANVPEFTSLFTMFENPVLGMLVGAVLTAVIQSSSASVGILQAMCVTGSVTIGAALPVIMGQNIGTCVTALISGVGASKNARRASLVHLYFNLIGTMLFMVVFYSVNVFVSFSFLQDTASAATIAVIHSVFNVVATVVLLPASSLLEKLAYITIPETGDEKEPDEYKVLDVRFLKRPAFAVSQCKTAACDIARMMQQAVGLISFVQNSYDELSVQKVMELEDIVDDKEDELSNYLTQLSAKPLSEIDSKKIGMYGKCVTDMERISDYAKGIAYAQKKLYVSEEAFSENARKEVSKIFAATMEIVENTVQCFVHEDVDLALRIDPLVDVISDLKKEIRIQHNRRLQEGKCSVEMGMTLTDMVTSLERIARHCSNIAEEQLVLDTKQHALHQLARSRKEGNELYKELYETYKEQYSIQ